MTRSEIEDYLLSRGVIATEIMPYSQGVASQNFRAVGEGGVDLVVRCDYRRSLAEVKTDRLYSELAAAQGVSVPQGPWVDGWIRTVATVVRPTMPGTPLSDLVTDRHPHPREIGRTLALIHSVRCDTSARKFFYAALFDASHTKWGAFDAATLTLAGDRKIGPLALEAMSRIRFLLHRKGQLARTPQALVHGDFTPPNILSCEGRLTVLDWEKSCVGPIMADIVQAIYYFAVLPGNNNSFAPEFLLGYAEISQLDIKALPHWLGFYPAFIFIWDAATFSTTQHASVEVAARIESYFTQVSAPRFARFLEIEHEIRRPLLYDLS